MESITGVSKGTLRRIKKEGDCGDGFTTPGKKHKGRVKATNGNRRVRQGYYTADSQGILHKAWREYPTLDKHLICVKEKIEFLYGRTTLKLFLKELVFKYEKFNCRNFLKERSDIVCLRCKYLPNIRKARAKGRKVIYLDETWCNHGSV